MFLLKKKAIYWLTDGAPFLVPITLLGPVRSEICSVLSDLLSHPPSSSHFHPLIAGLCYLCWVHCSSPITGPIDKDEFLPVPSSIIHPQPQWSSESIHLTLRLKVCIVTNASEAFHKLGPYQGCSPRSGPSHPYLSPGNWRHAHSLLSFTAGTHMLLARQPHPSHPSPDITAHTCQHSSSRHRARNLQDQVHHASATTQSPWLWASPITWSFLPKELCMACCDPAYDLSQSPSLGFCGCHQWFSEQLSIFIPVPSLCL